MSRPPTLLVFTLGSQVDTRRHPLLGPAASGLEVGLRGACLEAAFAAGRTAGLELVVCSPAPLKEAPHDARWLRQAEGSFGERFEAAVEQGQGGPSQPIVVVGGDVPGLHAGLIRAALEGLARDPEAVVVGPARDGGFYLLATARPMGPLLREVRWCAGDTRETLLAALARVGRAVVLLPALRDLDRPTDVEGWLSERRGFRGPVHLWADLVRRFLRARRLPPTRVGPRLSSPEATWPLRGRAPPVAALS